MKRLGIILVLGLLMTGCSSSSPEQPQPKKESSKIPTIPHQVSKDTDCKSCHATGANGAKVPKHIDRANCTQCHKPA